MKIEDRIKYYVADRLYGLMRNYSYLNAWPRVVQSILIFTRNQKNEVKIQGHFIEISRKRPPESARCQFESLINKFQIV